MKVSAKKGTKCPMEGKPRKYISDTLVVEVADTTYYRRLITDGSLVEVKEKEKAVNKTSKTKTTKKTKKGGK